MPNAAIIATIPKTVAHDLRRKTLVNGEPAAAIVAINQDSDAIR
jgi:hypothetical protein